MRTEEYLREALNQVRWRRARPALGDELRAHIEDQAAANRAAGMDERDAEEQALREMGDAAAVGGELDRAHRPAPQGRYLLIAVALMALGLLLYFLAPDRSGRDYRTSFRLLSSVLALGILCACYYFDYTRVVRLAVPVALCWAMFVLIRLYGGPVLWRSETLGLELPHFSFWMPELSVRPQHLAALAPAVLALLACRLRGRGGMIACLGVCALASLLAVGYRQTGDSPRAMLAMALICPALLLIAIRRGMFRLRHRRLAAWGAALVALYPLGAFARDMALSIRDTHQSVLQSIQPLLQGARLIGRGGALSLEAATHALFTNQTLAFFINRFGYLPFALFTAGVALLLALGIRKFARMGNKMGALVGLATMFSLAVRCALFYVNGFVFCADELCLPLISYSNVLLLFDAALIGLSLSALRGQYLAEAETRFARPRRQRAPA